MVIIFLLLLVFFLVRVDKQKVSFKTYPEFGIDMPTNFDIHGIDVSKYQKDIVWDAIKTMKVKEIKIHFSFIKATEGENLIDSKFAKNWAQAKNSQVTRGAYHFFRANKDVDKQVTSFIKIVKLLPGDLPPVLDIETLDNTTPEKIRAKAKIWLDKVEAYYGVKPIIYTNAEFYNKYLGTDFDDYPLWVAHYFEQHRPRIQRNWHFWQHSDRGNVNGIESKVDFNVFNGDSTDFENLLIKK